MPIANIKNTDSGEYNGISENLLIQPCWKGF